MTWGCLGKKRNQTGKLMHFAGLGCCCLGGADPCCDREVESWDVCHGSVW